MSTQLAAVLPALVNRLPPTGTVPSGGTLQQALEALIPKPDPA